MTSSAHGEVEREPDLDELLEVVSTVARRLDARQPEITRAMSQLLAREIPALNSDQRLVELLDASVEGNVKTIFHMLANQIPLEHLQPTTAAVEYALRLAQREIPANALARAYHMGQDDLMNLVFAEFQHLSCKPELKLRALHHISDVVYHYIDWVSLYVIDVHEKERKRWISTRANVHASLIHKIISRQPVNIAAFEADTGYRLEQNHVAAVVWSTRSTGDPDEHRHLEQFIRTVAAKSASVGPPLITAVDRATAWAWIPLRTGRHLDMAAIRTVAAATGTQVALGLPSSGLAGFIRSHEQAGAARQVALAGTEPTSSVVSFGDQGVGIVSLLAKDLDATTLWVHEVLGPLAINDENARALRETLSTYFATGENYAKTAELLNLHRNTVKYRVGKAFSGGAEGADGPSRMDLALALQVCQFLGAKVLRPRAE
jgi:DNA-binding PucR family transcriptional regulator